MAPRTSVVKLAVHWKLAEYPTEIGGCFRSERDTDEIKSLGTENKPTIHALTRF